MSEDKTYIDQARQGLIDSGGSEIGIRENLSGANELWDKIQKLRAEMSKAKKKAAKDAAAPFLKEIADLEEEYAFVIKLSS